MLVGTVMQILRILLVMLSLCPSRSEKDLGFRWALAEAIAETTDDEHEQDILARLGWYEASYRRAVARCEIKGDGGKSMGVFQVQPMTGADAKLACGSLVEQAGLALRYIHRSADMCPKNEGPAKLNLYVSGRCDRGLQQSKARWGEP